MPLLLVLAELALLLVVLELVVLALSAPVLSLLTSSIVASVVSAVVLVATIATTVLAITGTGIVTVTIASSTGSSRSGSSTTTQHDGRGQNGGRLAHKAGGKNGADGGGVLLRLAGAGLAVGFGGNRQGGDADQALVLNVLDVLEGLDVVGCVEGRLDVGLLDSEAATEGTGDGVVAATDSADVASGGCVGGQMLVPVHGEQKEE